MMTRTKAPKPSRRKRPRDEDYVIARNMEKSRQIAHYRNLYVGAIVFTLGVALLAMFVDYHIIREVWTRALSNEFMQVPDSLKSSVVFKSLQVVFAVLIVHFMLKITGVYGRNTMIVAAFLLVLVMIGSLGYLNAYNNMSGGTSTTLEHQQAGDAASGNSIDQLFSTPAKNDQQAQVTPASSTSEYSLPVPKLSQNSLANMDFLGVARFRQFHLLHRDGGGGALYAGCGEQHPQCQPRGRLQTSPAAVRAASPVATGRQA